MMVGTILFLSQLIDKVHLIGFLLQFPLKARILTRQVYGGLIKHITPNAAVSALDENVTIAKKCSILRVKFVVRGYVIGSTDTSLWTTYKKGARNYCGNDLPDGLVKNQRLYANVFRLRTKASDHDVPINPDEIVKRVLMTQADYDEASTKALNLFEYGQCVALEHGLIFVEQYMNLERDAMVQYY